MSVELEQQASSQTQEVGCEHWFSAPCLPAGPRPTGTPGAARRCELQYDINYSQYITSLLLI